MNLLALLCNLYAEGPATLRVLRRAGIRTLPNVVATSDWALAEFLGTSPAAARRFAREAARLAASAGEAAVQAFDVEEGSEAAAVLRSGPSG
ncbi:MAG: hypothetical protein ACKVXR_10535 [Planctomycetota bacterium]